MAAEDIEVVRGQYRVRGGKITYVEFHWERAGALKAAGSPERSEGEVH